MGKNKRKEIVDNFINKIENYIKNEFQLQIIKQYALGNHKWCSRADIGLDIKNIKLFVEIEEGQPHPDTNVTKYWYWINNEDIKNKVILIQVFGSDFYNNHYRSRSELCSFIANKIIKERYNFEYISIPKGKQHNYTKEWQLLDLLEATQKTIKEKIEDIYKA